MDFGIPLFLSLQMIPEQDNVQQDSAVRKFNISLELFSFDIRQELSAWLKSVLENFGVYWVNLVQYNSTIAVF